MRIIIVKWYGLTVNKICKWDSTSILKGKRKPFTIKEIFKKINKLDMAKENRESVTIKNTDE